MKTFRENDVVCLRIDISAKVIGQIHIVLVPKGTMGTVVLVHGDPQSPVAYEVEFFISDQNYYVLATVDALFLLDDQTQYPHQSV